MTKVTVIIPAYNAAATLARAARSVLVQTLCDIVVVIVDDGSTDSTPHIADELAAADARVCVIHKKNGGGYAARMAGLSAINSPYFAFLDADDWVEPDLYEKTVAFADKERLDVVQYEMVGAKTVGLQPEVVRGKTGVFTKVVRPYMIEGQSAFFVWDKLFKYSKKVVNWVSSSIMMFEDLKINFQVFEHVESFGFLHEGLYHYEINAGSSVRNFKKKNIADFAEMDAFRRERSPRFGVATDDSVHDHWFIKNMRNFLISACVAKAPNWNERLSNVRGLLEMPELSGALSRYVDGADRYLRFVCNFKSMPLSLSVAAVRTLKNLQRMFR